MTFDPKTLDRFNELLIELKAGIKYPVEEITLLLWNSGVCWDLAFQARERREPTDFYDFFRDYKTATLDECAAAVSLLEPDLLASVLCCEGRYVTHWDFYYDNEINNFFIAGVERLLALN